MVKWLNTSAFGADIPWFESKRGNMETYTVNEDFSISVDGVLKYKVKEIVVKGEVTTITYE